jgi:hypothetical protein
MSLLGRKTSLLEEASAVLREFQAVAEEPARERAQSFHRQQSGQAEEGRARRRSSTFTQLQSREYRDKAREARGGQQGGLRVVSFIQASNNKHPQTHRPCAD